MCSTGYGRAAPSSTRIAPMKATVLAWMLTGFGLVLIGLVGKVVMDVLLILSECLRGRGGPFGLFLGAFFLGIMILYFTATGAVVTWFVNGIAALTADF